MTMATVATHHLCCPNCKGQAIYSNTLGEQINIIGVDPLVGRPKQGLALGFTPSEGPCVLYFCGNCDYKNVVFSMFVRVDSE